MFGFYVSVVYLCLVLNEIFFFFETKLNINFNA